MAMKRVLLGKSGIEVSELCLGTMQFGPSCDEAEAERIISAALERGANFIDTAAAYGNSGEGECESMLGRILKGKRDQAVIATKLPTFTETEDIAQSLDESLERLQTDCVDLYMMHFPKVGMEPRRIMSAFNDAVVAGKARAIGCCNCPAWLVEHFNGIAAVEGWAPMTCHQVPYNPIERGIEVEILPQAKTTNVAITVYRSLLMGVLSGKYTKDSPVPEGSRGALDHKKKRPQGLMERHGDALDKFKAFADGLGVTAAQLAIAWVRHCPAVTSPLVGFSSLRQLDSTLGAFDIDLTDEQHAEIADIFDAEVKEETCGKVPLFRRKLDLVASED